MPRFYRERFEKSPGSCKTHGRKKRAVKERDAEREGIPIKDATTIRCPNCDGRSMQYAGGGVWVCVRCGYREERTSSC